MYILSTTMVLGLLIALLPEFSDRLFRRGKFGTVQGFRAALAASDRARKTLLGIVAVCWWTFFMLELATKMPSIGCAMVAFLFSLMMLRHDVFSAIVCLINDRATKVWWSTLFVLSMFFCFVPGWNLMGILAAVILLTAWFYPNTEQIWTIKLAEMEQENNGEGSLKIQVGE